MSAFNEHQKRLWRGMLQSIADFRQEKLTYFDFVGALEGALYAGEFKDRDLIEKWYGFWTPLEIELALKGNDVTREDVEDVLPAMQQYLESIIDWDDTEENC
jgi:hypothetical protein